MKKYFSSYWVRSAFYSVLQRFSLTLFGLINFIFLIRWLSQPQMGTWALFLTITTIFEATKSGLLKNAHVKYASSSKDDHEKSAIASSSLVINALISIIFVLLILFFSNWISAQLKTGPDLGTMLTWFIPGLLFMIFFSHLEAIAQSFLDFKGIFAGYLVRQVVFFIIILSHIVFDYPFSLPYLALYQSISILLGTITLYIFNKKYLLHRFDATTVWIKKIVGYGGYIFGSGVIANIYLNLDQIMTAKYISVSSVAYYNASSRINNLVDIPSYAAAEILFPKSAQASVSEEGTARVKYLYERMVGILLSFTIPVAIFIIIFPQFVMTVIAGSKYALAAPILQLYMITGLIRPMQNQAANMLNSIGKAKLCFLINSSFLVINLSINFLCLSTLGFYGAAIGTLISNVIGFIIWYAVMKRQIGLQLPNVAVYVLNFYKSAYLKIRELLSAKEKEVPAEGFIVNDRTETRIAHLIIAHKNPAQLERLIKTLDHDAFDFYIHIDKKTDERNFLYLSEKENVFLIKKRTKIYWAGYGTIQATLNGFEEILLKPYSYINVISGQDFPLKPPEYIRNYFTENKGKEFITCKLIYEEWTEAIVRLEKYHLINWRIPGKFKVEKLVNKILPERKFPLDYIMVGRSNWFTITGKAAKYIIDFLARNPKVVRFYKYSWGADECIFATILYNSGFKDQITENLVYADWSEQTAHPKILTSKDFTPLMRSQKLFARKFDTDIDLEILEMIEEFISR